MYIFPRHSIDSHQLSALWRCRYLEFSSTLPHRKKALPVFCKESSISKHVCIVIWRTENLSWNYNLNIQYKLSFQQTFIYTWVLLTIIKYLPQLSQLKVWMDTKDCSSVTGTCIARIVIYSALFPCVLVFKDRSKWGIYDIVFRTIVLACTVIWNPTWLISMSYFLCCRLKL